MTQVNRMKTVFYSLGLAMLLMAAVLVGIVRTQTSYAQAEAPLAPSIYINPASASVNVGSSTTVAVMVGEVANVLGAQISVTFNASIVNIVDADAGTAGVQVTVGDCPIDVVAVNDGNNTIGDLFYAAANGISNPACSATSFTVASIQFQCMAVGTTAVTFVTGDPLGTVLADSDGNDITPAATNGSITCNASTGSIAGVVNLSHRGNDAYATVDAYSGGSLVASTTTNATGNFTLLVPAGTYSVTATITRYLDSEGSGAKTGVIVTSGNTTNLPTVNLPGGDTNNNGLINIQDVTIITNPSAFGQIAPNTSANLIDRADINDSGVINIQDITIVTFNFTLTEPIVWP